MGTHRGNQLGFTSELFSQRIQPLLASIPTSAIRSRIGVSRWYAGKIRQGYCPHPRHWLALAQLAGVSANASETTKSA
jgi:hypothetical protein